MHPRMIGWAALRGDCCTPSNVGSERHGAHRHRTSSEEPAGPFGGGAFGVRRPLRFLAWKLGLDETQVGELARVLNELKTERAQAAVDARRTLTALADAVAGESFDEARANEAAHARVQSTERLQKAVVLAVARIHSLLEPEQRSRLAYMIRTGALML